MGNDLTKLKICDLTVTARIFFTFLYGFIFSLSNSHAGTTKRTVIMFTLQTTTYLHVYVVHLGMRRDLTIMMHRNQSLRKTYMTTDTQDMRTFEFIRCNSPFVYFVDHWSNVIMFTFMLVQFDLILTRVTFERGYSVNWMFNSIWFWVNEFVWTKLWKLICCFFSWND